LTVLDPRLRWGRFAGGGASDRTLTPGSTASEIVGELLAATLVTALGSLFAASDTALAEIPEGRLQALSAEATSSGAAFKRFARDPLRVVSRWLVGRVVCLSVASVLLGDAAHHAGLVRLALPTSVLGAVFTYGTFTEILATFARRRPERVGELGLVFLRPLEWLLIPLADPLAMLGRAVRRRVSKSRPRSSGP
jgi:CBS domain containing-hemolysin-like protein